MSEPIIRVENLSKKYIIGHQKQEKYSTLRDMIANGAKSVVQTITNSQKRVNNNREEFWALKDISFEIKQGDRVGIIGHNGAGKSTLLKILSRITEPTKGKIKINGRVASLLEVGTGFHPELTGRENIFLNGAILGMSKFEIKRKFDEIVAFAEVEKFLDTPVKRYSSGMYVRLAFAVAAHLEPEILVVDEVLAVGDSAFQKKCLGKMEEVGKEGRTVLFVSHNMSAIQNLCTRGILLQRGTVIADKTTEETVISYLNNIEIFSKENILDRKDRRGKGKTKLASIKILGDSNKSTALATGRPAHFLFEVTHVLSQISCIFTIYDRLGNSIVNFNSALYSSQDSTNPEIGAKFICEIDKLPLMPGQYSINVLIEAEREIQDHIECAALFDVQPGVMQGRPVKARSNSSHICIPHIWTVPV